MSLAPNNHIKFAPVGRRTLLASRRLCGRYASKKMSQIQSLKPIIFAGKFCIVITLGGVFFQLFALEKMNFDDSFKYFVAITSLIHLVVGLGVLSLKRWGYYVIKLYLYFIIFGFPIGTLLSFKALKYLNQHNIQEHYK